MTLTSKCFVESSLLPSNLGQDPKFILPPWVIDMRRAGFARYQNLGGAPTIKSESWKYTDLRPILAKNYHFKEQPVTSLDLSQITGILSVPYPQVTLVNGCFSPNLSSLESLDSTDIQPLDQALQNDGSGRLKKFLLVPEYAPALVALGIAWMRDGLVVRFKNKASKALHIVSISTSTSNEMPIFIHPTIIVIVEAGSQATLVESHIGLSSAFVNLISPLYIEENATLLHVLTQSGNYQTNMTNFTNAQVSAQGTYQRLVITTGLGLIRNELITTLNAQGAGCHLYGAYSSGSNCHIDNTITVNHVAPMTTSHQLFKGVLNHNGRGVFQGNIKVQSTATKSKGHQLHKALLLSSEAEVDCKPELEIYTDDVQCSHGATTSNLDDNTIFYLRTRGLNIETARAILVQAFLNDIIDTAIGTLPQLSHAMYLIISSWLSQEN